MKVERVREAGLVEAGLVEAGLVEAGLVKEWHGNVI